MRTRHTFDAVIDGFAAELNAGQLNALRRNPAVLRIEEDQQVRADRTIRAAATQSNATWGLDRIDQRNLPLSTTYGYNTTAPNVTAYIIDTGIDPSHPDFGNRATIAYDATLEGHGLDCNGHGTHVAGTIGGTTYGVAKGAKLRGVRVLNCSGIGTNADVIEGMDWVRTHAVKPAVANMSLGGGFSATVNSVATSLNNSGVFLAVAAGNEEEDACKTSLYQRLRCDDRRGVGQDRHRRLLHELRFLRGDLRARRLHHLRLAPGHHQHPQRHLDGQPARRGCGCALQGRQG